MYYPQAYEQSGDRLNDKISFTQIIAPHANRPTLLGQKCKTKLVLSTNQKNITVKLDHRPICMNKKEILETTHPLLISHIFTYTYPVDFFECLDSLGKYTPWRILWPMLRPIHEGSQNSMPRWDQWLQHNDRPPLLGESRHDPRATSKNLRTA